jgi:hypothetical protein
MKNGISKNKILFQSKLKRVLKLLSSYIEIICKKRPEALKSLYRSPGNKKNQLVLCKNYVLQW